MEVWISCCTWSRSSDESNLKSMCNKSEPHIEKLWAPYGGGLNLIQRRTELRLMCLNLTGKKPEPNKYEVWPWTYHGGTLNLIIEDMQTKTWQVWLPHEGLNLAWKKSESLMEKDWIAWRTFEQREKKVWTSRRESLNFAKRCGDQKN